MDIEKRALTREINEKIKRLKMELFTDEISNMRTMQDKCGDALKEYREYVFQSDGILVGIDKDDYCLLIDDGISVDRVYLTDQTVRNRNRKLRKGESLHVILYLSEGGYQFEPVCGNVAITILTDEENSLFTDFKDIMIRLRNVLSFMKMTQTKQEYIISQSKGKSINYMMIPCRESRFNSRNGSWFTVCSRKRYLQKFKALLNICFRKSLKRCRHRIYGQIQSQRQKHRQK